MYDTMRTAYKVFLHELRIALLVWGIILLLNGLVSYAGAQGRWQKYSSNPETILDQVINKANTHKVDTALNKVNDLEGWYETQFQIANTLDSIRLRIPVYIQWLVFLALVSWAMLIMYNGFLLVTSPLSSTEIGTVQKRITYIAAGVALVSWFYYILRITLSILLNLVSTT
jgi:hypothetical protein